MFAARLSRLEIPIFTITTVATIVITSAERLSRSVTQAFIITIAPTIVIISAVRLSRRDIPLFAITIAPTIVITFAESRKACDFKLKNLKHPLRHVSERMLFLCYLGY